jgi:hypothetical protein
MGKGARSRANYAEKKAAQVEREQAKKKQQKINTIITLAIVVVLLAGIAAMVGVNVYRNSGATQRAQIVMKTDNFEVNGSMMSYLIFSQYANYLNAYGDYISYMGLDPQKPLRDQYTTDDANNSITWLQYFTNTAKSSVENLLVLCESAKANGVELTATEKKAVAERAKDSYTNVGQYAVGVNEQAVVDCMELSLLATKYQLVVEDGLMPTVEQIDEYYTKNPLKVLKADYYSYSFGYEEPAEGETLAEEKVSKDEAKALADDLATAANVEQFKTKLKTYLESIAEEPKEGEEKAEINVDSYKTTAGTYNESSEASKWLFNDATTVGSVKVIEDTSAKNYTVYVLDKAKYLQEDKTASVRQLLINKIEGSVTAEQAHKTAQGYYDQFLKGDKSEQSFADLAMLHTEDGNYYNGGLYQGVFPGQMVASFNSWCFDAARKPGDTGLVDSDYGSHLIYFVGEDLPRWKTDVRTTLLQEAYEAKYEELKKAVTINTDDGLISNLDVQR